MSYLKDHKGNDSSIRVALAWAIAHASLGFQTVCIVLILQAINDVEIDWIGAAAFITALSAYMYQSGKNKVDQKKIELNKENEKAN